MKSLILLLYIPMMALLTAAGFSAKPEGGGQAVIKFDEKVHDFGIISQGDKATHVFKFTNTGDVPLVIAYVEKACGCMEPVWPKEPVMPGQSGEIKVTYTTKSRPGEFRKTLMVKSNADEGAILLIKGNVVPKKELSGK